MHVWEIVEGEVIVVQFLSILFVGTILKKLSPPERKVTPGRPKLDPVR